MNKMITLFYLCRKILINFKIHCTISFFYLYRNIKNNLKYYYMVFCFYLCHKILINFKSYYKIFCLYLCHKIVINLKFYYKIFFCFYSRSKILINFKFYNMISFLFKKIYNIFIFCLSLYIIPSQSMRCIRMSKYLELSAVVIGFSIIIFLLELNFFACCILVIFITSIILGIRIILENIYLFNDTLYFLILLCGFDTLIDLAITPEFHMNYTHLSEIDVVLLHTGTARIIIAIAFNKNAMSFFSCISRIKTSIYEFLPFFKKKPLFYLAIGITIYLLFINFINLCC